VETIFCFTNNNLASQPSGLAWPGTDKFVSAVMDELMKIINSISSQEDGREKKRRERHLIIDPVGALIRLLISNNDDSDDGV
jgi:hypothetical protein